MPMKTSFIQRLLTTVIGVPMVFSIMVFLPQAHFLGISLVVLACSILGSIEMSRILLGRFHPFCLLPSLIVIGSWLDHSLELPISLQQTALFACILVFLALAIFTDQDNGFKAVRSSVSSLALITLYPSYLLSYLLEIVNLEVEALQSNYLLLIFIALVFSNDIFAYVFGMLLGRKSQGIVKVSPHKSLAGFIGGGACCMGVSWLLFSIFLPQLSWALSLALGLGISLAANIGDLAESAFKRSAGIKDSGAVIPGRGGILDCVDSISFSAPVFYLMLELVL